MRAQDRYCGLRCDECGPGSPASINDCGPERLLYGELGVQIVRAATAMYHEGEIIEFPPQGRFVREVYRHIPGNPDGR